MSSASGPSARAAEGSANGLVVAAHGRHCMVETGDGTRLLCHARGKKSDVVVGDRVHWQPAGDEGVIDKVAERRNLLFRQDEWKTKSFAANLDQLLVLVAVEPMYAETQLARALIAAESAGIPTVIILNKIDLPTLAAARERLAPYRNMGVQVLELSLKARGDEARALLTPLLAGKATLVLGPSGMGKSTLINLMVPAAAAQVGEISKALNAGKHTTTDTRWYWLDEGRSTALIDSPGFQEFGLRQLQAPELAPLMPDIGRHAQACRFYNCSHLHEPGCGVRDALARGEIHPSRYRIFTELNAELSTKRY
ncbi:MAG: ribosome small subunit-dependent GTPase A [Burkholderiales bacterium RIFCSPHIGHO2_12_FULL_69_20]|nr:MAG: ribosome small subunit-dependent GTPase A [Burkholderiales bacterium RIFCSPHIGHO2_12_FULL_69_20]